MKRSAIDAHLSWYRVARDQVENTAARQRAARSVRAQVYARPYRLRPGADYDYVPAADADALVLLDPCHPAEPAFIFGGGKWSSSELRELLQLAEEVLELEKKHHELAREMEHVFGS